MNILQKPIDLWMLGDIEEIQKFMIQNIKKLRREFFASFFY